MKQKERHLKRINTIGDPISGSLNDKVLLAKDIEKCIFPTVKSVSFKWDADNTQTLLEEAEANLKKEIKKTQYDYKYTYKYTEDTENPGTYTEEYSEPTGHLDEGGLRAIGWDDEDIEFAKKYVDWDAEDDFWHNVPQELIDFYNSATKDSNDTTAILPSTISSVKSKIWFKYCPKISSTGMRSSLFQSAYYMFFIPKIDFSNISSGEMLFYDCWSLIALPQLDFSSAYSLFGMFCNCRSLKTIVGITTTQNIFITSGMFSGCSSLTSVPLFNTSKVTTMNSMFFNCYSLLSVPHFDTSKVTTMGQMFCGCSSLVSVPQFDTSNVTNMYYMFGLCYSLVYVPLFDTSKVTTMENIFTMCYSLVSVPLFNTSKVTTMNSMFYTCYSLLSVPRFDTSKVTNMRQMFYGCSSLVSVPQFDTSNVTNMEYMFFRCISLKHGPKLNMANVTTCKYIYNECANLFDVYFYNAKKCSNYSYALYAANNLKEIHGLNLKNVTSSSNFSMFRGNSPLEYIDNLELSTNTGNAWGYYLYLSTYTSSYNFKYIKLTNTTPPPTDTFYFYTCKKIYVPNPVVDAYKAATNWISMADRIYGYDCELSEDVKSYATELGVLDEVELYCYRNIDIIPFINEWKYLIHSIVDTGYYTFLYDLNNGYINTGLIPDIKSRMKAVFDVRNNTGAGDYNIMGTRIGGNKYWWIGMHSSKTTQVAFFGSRLAGSYKYLHQLTPAFTYSVYDSDVFVELEIDFRHNAGEDMPVTYKIKDWTATFNVNSSYNFNTNIPVYLFAANGADNTHDSEGFAVVEFESSDNTLHKFVPFYNGTEFGMLDLYDYTFHGNINTEVTSNAFSCYLVNKSTAVKTNQIVGYNLQ